MQIDPEDDDVRAKQDLDNLWAFIQPVGLYNVLAARKRCFLPRNLQYTHRCAVRSSPQSVLRVRIGGASDVPKLTVFLAVCETLQLPGSGGIKDLIPRSATLTRLRSDLAGPVSATVTAASDSDATPHQQQQQQDPCGSTVDFGLPWLPEGEELADPCLLLLVWEGAPDVGTILHKCSGCRLSCSSKTGYVLGLIPSSDTVLAACTPLKKGNDDVQPRAQQRQRQQQQRQGGEGMDIDESGGGSGGQAGQPPQQQQQQGTRAMDVDMPSSTGNKVEQPQQQHCQQQQQQKGTLQGEQLSVPLTELHLQRAVAVATCHKVQLGGLGVHELQSLRLLGLPKGSDRSLEFLHEDSHKQGQQQQQQPDHHPGHLQHSQPQHQHHHHHQQQQPPVPPSQLPTPNNHQTTSHSGSSKLTLRVSATTVRAPPTTHPADPSDPSLLKNPSSNQQHPQHLQPHAQPHALSPAMPHQAPHSSEHQQHAQHTQHASTAAAQHTGAADQGTRAVELVHTLEQCCAANGGESGGSAAHAAKHSAHTAKHGAHTAKHAASRAASKAGSGGKHGDGETSETEEGSEDEGGEHSASPSPVRATATGRPMRSSVAAMMAKKAQQQKEEERSRAKRSTSLPPHDPRWKPLLSEREQQLAQCTWASFRYMHGDEGLSYKQEVQDTCRCPFCDLVCRNGLGLQQHLVATHEHFFYRFILPPPPTEPSQPHPHLPINTPPSTGTKGEPQQPFSPQGAAPGQNPPTLVPANISASFDQSQQGAHTHAYAPASQRMPQQEHHHHRQEQQQQQQQPQPSTRTARGSAVAHSMAVHNNTASGTGVHSGTTARGASGPPGRRQAKSRKMEGGPGEGNKEGEGVHPSHAHPGWPRHLLVLVHVPAAMYNLEGRMLVADGDMVLDQQLNPARLLWFFHRRLHPTRLFTHNLAPGSPLEQELHTPPSTLAAEAAAPQNQGAKKSSKGVRAQLPRNRGQQSRLAQFRKPPFYELDQPHHWEGRLDGFRSMLEKKAGQPVWNRGRAAGDAPTVPLTLRQIDVVDASTRRQTPGALSGSLAVAAAGSRKSNNVFGYNDSRLAQDLYGPFFPEARYYFHAHSTMPMTCEDLEECPDSDDETDSEQWEVHSHRDLLSVKSQSETERHFMLLWNRFCRRHPPFADYIMHERCERFVHECRADLLELGDGTLSEQAQAERGAPGRHALVMHLLCLFEHALINGASVDRCLKAFDDG